MERDRRKQESIAQTEGVWLRRGRAGALRAKVRASSKVHGRQRSDSDTPGPGTGPENAAPSAPAPPRQGCSGAGTLRLSGDPMEKSAPTFLPQCVFLAPSPGPAAVFTLSPVCFASSAHTAFADMRNTVGWENFFLLCFCRKCSWLRAGHRESWVSRPQFRDCGWEGPPQAPDIPSTAPQPRTLARHTFLPDRNAPQAGLPSPCPGPGRPGHPGPGVCPRPPSSCSVPLPDFSTHQA